jgi:hypothetical protein
MQLKTTEYTRELKAKVHTTICLKQKPVQHKPLLDMGCDIYCDSLNTKVEYILSPFVTPYCHTFILVCPKILAVLVFLV